MKILKKDMNQPVLLGYPHDDNTQLAVWCCYCYRWHYHGIGEGSRTSHCINPYSPFLETGYIIKQANKVDLKHHNEKTFSKDEYVNYFESEENHLGE
ncbi:hypothetical protein [uncultured Vagococcus sp.]|uniref:hypothetical protein n=1 Tax=uncultured Vagococcus sp. TaxID=189676 RepID=UPI0028D0C0BF|nr:hypothetical protein [uncultured Vagococcus sp.]